MKHLLLIALIATVSAWGAPVDFTFKVPVKLVKVRSSDAQVMCTVYNAQHQSIAGKFFRFDLNGDGQYTYSYNGTVTIEMSVHSGKDPRDGETYECQLSLLLPWASPPWQKPISQGSDIYLTPQPGTPFAPLVSGSIPKPKTIQQRVLPDKYRSLHPMKLK
ncbi:MULTISPECIES: hypothetical protein [Sulfurimonas]|uniref:Ig-like domain-containing protein n=1 Tax=Sulfurimonas diazotrophicus TaxID=3131939 RepID=A0ABZ3HCC6_9BACT